MGCKLKTQLLGLTELSSFWRLDPEEMMALANDRYWLFTHLEMLLVEGGEQD